MTEIATDGAPAMLPEPTATLVWVDSRRAVVVRWIDGEAVTARLESAVPAPRRAPGHVRHDPMVRHGGGGEPQTAGDPHRNEHLRRFIDAVADRLEGGGPVTLLGPGTVHEHLEKELRERDLRTGRAREVTAEASRPMTDRQLVARLRHSVDADPPRRTVGAYRWSVPMAQQRSGKPTGRPQRVAPKPPAERE